jgi:hypothetical protein
MTFSEARWDNREIYPRVQVWRQAWPVSDSPALVT